MAEHEKAIGMSDEWYTPPEYFDAMGLRFALDPCSPGSHHWVPAARVFTIADDGLRQEWGEGLVFMNPPFGGRFGQVPWLERFFAHGNGIALVRSYTSSSWWHDYAPKADGILFPRGKTQFVRGTAMVSVNRKGDETRHEAGTRGKSPGHGVALLSVGDVACDALDRCNLGMFWDRRSMPRKLSREI
ncbi:DNA N-6-adenine-methyltransferase [Bradyrhizobium sp. USDA 4452]